VRPGKPAGETLCPALAVIAAARLMVALDVTVITGFRTAEGLTLTLVSD
jgi:hypothetical protein